MAARVVSYRGGRPRSMGITEQLIREGVCVPLPPPDDERGPRPGETGPAATLTPRPAIELHEAEWVSLSFKDISRIDHLVGLPCLTKLQLDNNKIARIENLGHLVTLQWLVCRTPDDKDLSFNEITKVEGLESLVHLTDLTLYGNAIEILEGLTGLPALTCLSIGKNRLQDLDAAARYLRRMKQLRMVTLAGNPLCKHPGYESVVLSHVPFLRFLDHRLVDSGRASRAAQEHREQLMELEAAEAKEGEEQRAAADAAAMERQMAALQLPGMLGLFQELFTTDPQAAHMNAFIALEPVLQAAVEKFRGSFGEATDDFRQRMSEHRMRRDAEDAEFAAAVAQCAADTDTKARGLIRAFEKAKKALVAGARAALAASAPRSDPEDATAEDDPAGQRWAEIRARLESLQEELLELEMDQSEALEDVIRTYDQAVTEITDQTVETIGSSFGRLREEERAYFDALFQAFVGLVERRHAVQAQTMLEALLADDPNQQVLALLDNKEDILKMINESHEAHEQRLYAKEEHLVAAQRQQLAESTRRHRDAEHARSRARVMEIAMYVNAMAQEIDATEDDDDGA